MLYSHNLILQFVSLFSDATFCKGISYNQKKIYIGQLTELIDLSSGLLASVAIVTDTCYITFLRAIECYNTYLSHLEAILVHTLHSLSFPKLVVSATVLLYLA